MAIIKLAQTFQALEGSGLTGAIGTQQTKDLSPGDFEADIVDRFEAVIILGEILDGYDRLIPMCLLFLGGLQNL